MAHHYTEGELVHLERDWAARSFKADTTPELRALWDSFGYSSRHYVSPTHPLIAWTVGSEGEPEVLDILCMDAIELSTQQGMTITLRSLNGSVHNVTSKPSRLFSLDVFVWAPSFNDVRWTPPVWNIFTAQRLLRVGLDYRLRESLTGPPVKGHHYFTPLHKFRRSWPHVGIPRFLLKP